ncbi:PREDICTED: uncharacterized protein C14orf105 homolog isoform X2 [Condylura cristata]|uniref:uncharacterized protein C14orf105 homolog isoform X2 n=1 Tax=Condylura cristata TaxID=143302 RepID=UPI00064383AE|nr:PREDICTED: uncharacterized protein C14orf105 homolog isoform X2 [Condylura cristata]
MGLNHSKTHPRVTKVAPYQNKEGETALADPVDFAFNQNLEEQSSCSLATVQDRSAAVGRQLPPLRDTWYGRHSAVPRPIYFDIPVEQGETSIIKRHPPRRLQKLEPVFLPTIITAERHLCLQEAERTHKAKGLEEKMQTSMYTSGTRQYLHKMQMLEMNRKRQEAQVELKKSLHRESKTSKQKSRENKAKKTFQRNDVGDYITLLPDESLITSPGKLQSAEFWEHQARNDYCPQQIGKMESWFREQETRGQLLWDSSSSDSDASGKDERKPRALVRTRTERIPLFDELFDQE